MYTKNIAALAGALAIIDHALALNVHRQGHNKMHKRQDAVVWETVMETVYVTEPYYPPAATPEAPPPASPEAPPPAANKDSVVDSQDDKIGAAINAALPTPAPQAVSPPVAPVVDEAPKSALSAPPAAPTNYGATGTSSNGTGGSSSGPGFGKRGLAYNDPLLANMVGSSAKKGVFGWGHNWGQYGGALDSQYEFIPTLWGQKMDFCETWPSTASKAVANGVKALFSFNEPDNKGQANMDPSTAATLFVQYMNPYADKTKIGAPAVSNSNIKGEGLDWLKSWVGECKSKGCKYHFCNVHWYSPVDAIDTLFSHIEQAHQICDGMPIWLTEFAPVGADASQTADFLAKALPKLDALDYLHGYSYFMVGSGDLQLLSGSALNAIGSQYININL